MPDRKGWPTERELRKRFPGIRGLARAIRERMESGHSVFSPSSGDMWMTCAGSLIPNILAHDSAGEEAAEGTVAHDLAETWLNWGDDVARARVGEVVLENGFEITITEEMLGYVGDYVAYVRKWSSGYDEKLTEQKLKYGKLVPLPDQGGTGDFLGMTWQELRIIDLKYGKGVQVFTHLENRDGEITYRNYQTRIYALMAFLEHDWLYNFQRIHIHIAQPRLDHFQTLEITREEMLDFADQVRDAAEAAFQPNAPRSPSEKACQWCAIKGSCSAAYLMITDETDGIFTNYEEDVANTHSYTPAQMSSALVRLEDDFETEPLGRIPNPGDMSTYAIANLLRYQSLVEKMFAAMRDELLTRATSDEEDVIFWKVVEARTRRKWQDDEEHIVAYLEEHGLHRTDLYVTELKSPAQIEKLLHTKAGHKVKESARLLEAVVYKPPGQKTLVQNVDKRPALPNDGDVFTDLSLENPEEG